MYLKMDALVHAELDDVCARLERMEVDLRPGHKLASFAARID